MPSRSQRSPEVDLLSYTEGGWVWKGEPRIQGRVREPDVRHRPPMHDVPRAANTVPPEPELGIVLLFQTAGAKEIVHILMAETGPISWNWTCVPRNRAPRPSSPPHARESACEPRPAGDGTPACASAHSWGHLAVLARRRIHVPRIATCPPAVQGFTRRNVHPGPQTAFVPTRHCQPDALPRTPAEDKPASRSRPPRALDTLPRPPGLGSAGRCSRCGRRANTDRSSRSAGTRANRSHSEQLMAAGVFRNFL